MQSLCRIDAKDACRSNYPTCCCKLWSGFPLVRCMSFWTKLLRFLTPSRLSRSAVQPAKGRPTCRYHLPD